MRINVYNDHIMTPFGQVTIYTNSKYSINKGSKRFCEFSQTNIPRLE